MTASDRARLARRLLAATIVYVVGFYCVGSAIKPGYSQLSNFISEYNATGTAWAGTLTWAGFFASAVLQSAFLVAAATFLCARGGSRAGYALLWCLPASFLLAVVAPCDAGCPVEGSASQALHNIGGILAYLGMGAGIALLGMAPAFRAFALRRACLIGTGAAFPIVFVLMVQPELESWRGLLQRGLDVALAISLALALRTLIPDMTPLPGHRLAKSLFVLLACLLPTASAQEFDHDAYRQSTLADARTSLALDARIAHLYDAAHSKYRVDATFTGGMRPTDPATTRFISQWVIAMRHPPEYGRMFGLEVEIAQSGTTYWMPIQDSLVGPWKQEATAGGDVELYVLLLGASNQLPVFAISSFSAGTP